MSFQKRFFLLLESLLYVAEQPGTNAVSGKAISTALGLTPRYMEPLLQDLVKAGLLRGVRGPKGGYLLAKERRKILLSSLYPLAQENEEIVLLYKSVTKPLGDAIEDAIVATLGEKTLEDMVESLGQKAPKTKPDFTI
jgi:Rrf2 family iron-sulfur cluster assembly transcriptional regulator